MDKWREILNKRELPSIDENKKRQSIEILKMEIANTEITVKESYFEKIKRYIPFMSKITFLFQFILLLVGILVIKSMNFEKTRLILSLVMAILIAESRIQAKEHRLSEVIFSACLGTILVLVLYGIARLFIA